MAERQKRSMASALSRIPLVSHIIQGVVIGVSAGLVLQGINWGVSQYHRSEQIRYLRTLLEDARWEIYGVKPLSHPENPEQFLSVHVMRWAQYELFRLRVFSALRERCVNMTYDQIHAVRMAFRDLEIVLEKAKQAGKTVQPPLELYKRFFERLHGLKWLQLPPMNPPPWADEMQ